MLRVIFILILFTSLAQAQDGRPYDYSQEENPLLPHGLQTPGSLTYPAPKISEMCSREFRKKIPEISQELKQKVFEAYGIDPNKSSLYHIDHLITPEVGGGNDIKNLWPQSLTSRPWNAHMKDRLENHLHREICQGRMSPNHAQTLLTLDWIDSYCIIFEDMTKECLDYRKKRK